MKKLILIAMAIIAGLNAQAQYKIGDVIEKDGIKAVVIKVNGDGSHGLMLKLEKISTLKEMKEQAKNLRAEGGVSKEDSRALFKQYKKEVINNDSVQNLRKHHMLAVCEETTLDGKHNFEVIEKYCADNGIDMLDIFPDFAIVKNLGEGWFIPGDKELAYIHNFISRGFGTTIKPKFFKEVISKIQKNKGFEKYGLPGFFSATTPCFGYKSSTWTTDNYSKKDKFNGIMPHCSILYNKTSIAGFEYYYQMQTGNYEQRLTAFAIKETISLYDIWRGKKLAIHLAAVCEF